MTDKHLTDEDIQAYVTDPEILTPAALVHVSDCSHCQKQIEVYRQLFSVIAEQPAFKFDIDLPATVLDKIKPEKERVFGKLMLPGIISVFVVVPTYLFRKNFVYFFSGLSDFFTAVCVCLFCSILILKSIQLYNNYRKQLDKINILQKLQP